MLQENQSNNHRQIFAREMTNKSLKMEGNKHLGLKIRRGCDKDTLPTRTGARHTVPPIESACLITHTSQKKKKHCTTINKPTNRLSRNAFEQIHIANKNTFAIKGNPCLS